MPALYLKAVSLPHYHESMNDIGREFIVQSRYHLTEDYLPKIERCISLLTGEQIWWRANPESNSIGNLLLHLSGNVRQWIVSGVGNQRDERNRDSEFAQREVISAEDLLQRLRISVKEADSVLANFDPSRLLEKRQIQGLDTSILEAILHVVEHFSMHTGQIILLTKQLTAQEMDFYDFQGDRPLLRWQSDPSSSS